MKNNKPNNPRAFPFEAYHPRDTNAPFSLAHKFIESGMTLLDYFAGQALVALIIASNYEPGKRADRAYEIANDMLESREEKL